MAHKLLKNRIDQLYFKILEVSPHQRNDLKRMWKHAREIWSEIDMEMVVCRRLGKETTKKKELTEKLEESLTAVEQYLTWAKLLS